MRRSSASSSAKRCLTTSPMEMMPRPPPYARPEECPAAVLVAGDVPSMARPGPNRRGRHEVACALGGRAGWARKVPVEERQEDECIDEEQGLVMGDVLLRLVRREQRQTQVAGGHGSSSEDAGGLRRHTGAVDARDLRGGPGQRR